MVKLSTDQIERFKTIWPNIKSGKAKDINSKVQMVVLHNDVFGTNYRPQTSCVKCLAECLKGMKKIHKVYG
jgi:hypothetical protein